MVPYFAAGKIFFPIEMRETPIMAQFMSEISLATQSGIKGKDDCLDTISMLAEMNPWLPAVGIGHNGGPDMFEEDDDRDNKASYIDSYIV